MQQFIDDLIETMHDADGAGLAAIQVYQPIAICAIEVRNNPRYPVQATDSAHGIGQPGANPGRRRNLRQQRGSLERAEFTRHGVAPPARSRPSVGSPWHAH